MSTNTNNYKAQQCRAWSRKLELIQMMGGKCSCCGYDRNIAALEFHHTDPSNKSFQLDSRHLSNSSIERIKEEAEKCILLCSNCHKEIHYPNQTKEQLAERTYSNKSISEKKYKTDVCPVCGKEFRHVKGKIYCSDDCREAAKGYPTYEEVLVMYRQLKSKQKVAEHYGLTRKIIVGILKRAK